MTIHLLRANNGRKGGDTADGWDLPSHCTFKGVTHERQTIKKLACASSPRCQSEVFTLIFHSF
jgi:hypothetical protein